MMLMNNLIDNDYDTCTVIWVQYNGSKLLIDDDNGYDDDYEQFDW